MTPPLHENDLVRAYLASRDFSGFKIKAHDNRLELTSTESSIISVLAFAKFTQEDEDSIALDVAPLVAKRTHIRRVIIERRMDDSGTIDLVEALTAIHAYSDPAIRERLDSGYVMFHDLPVLFPRGAEVVCDHVSGPFGGIVESCSERQTYSGPVMAIELSILMPTSTGFQTAKTTHTIRPFDQKLDIAQLPVRKITETEKAELTLRGQRCVNAVQKPTLMSYRGTLTIPGWVRDTVLSADGRVMVDPENLPQVDADIYHEMMRTFKTEEHRDAVIDAEHKIAPSDFWRCYNRVQGFSMRLKRWGWLDVRGLSHVDWREDAFEKLVLEPKQKRTLLHLVQHYGSSFTDFIDGKSGGLIFLLHGPAGSGKTLSAEAVAETLRRPLYSISVGELGTTPEEMETKLRTILDLAYHWNAVLLLDEADIFMEARDTTNVTRNAMVSIFLRLLEYYSGVMMLTTNRVMTFDPAFFSRISLAISYPSLNAADRENVWRNVLTSAGVDISELDLRDLAARRVNGRNIKSVVRIAQTIAAGDGRTVEQSDLTEVLSMTASFNKLIERPS